MDEIGRRFEIPVSRVMIVAYINVNRASRAVREGISTKRATCRRKKSTSVLCVLGYVGRFFGSCFIFFVYMRSGASSLGWRLRFSDCTMVLFFEKQCGE